MYDEATATLTTAWGVEPYRKLELISDPTGDRWSEWVARALPALRQWVGREHKAYLRNVHLSLPCTDRFDAIALGNALRDTAPASDGAARSPREVLKAATTVNLVSQGEVVLVPEHELVAAHYLGVLGVIQKAAQAYASRFESHEDLRRDQAQRRDRWRKERAAADAYNASIKWYTFWKWGSQKSGPTGSVPEVADKLVDPTEWMEDLVAHPEQFDHVVLLDAGGLSLDISVLENHGLVRELSHSDTTCGGEAISSNIGRRMPGWRGTGYKAQLGIRWRQSRDADSRDQREYRDITRELHRPVLTRLIDGLGGRWERSPHCCVLLTGGGSRNPHLAEYIAELAAQAGLQANVVDAPVVQELIRKAREFPEPLQELGSDEIRRFEATRFWSERREPHPDARYDKFAVVGGMCALGGGRL